MNAIEHVVSFDELPDPADDLRQAELDADSDLPKAWSAEVEPLRVLPAKRTRNKRTEADMLMAANQEGTLAAATYVQNRLVKLEEKMAELLAGVSTEAAELVLSQRGFEHLRRYLP